MMSDRSWPSDGSLELDCDTACELYHLGMAVFVDVRQPCEQVYHGEMAVTLGLPCVELPYLAIKRMAGLPLTAEDEEILGGDASEGMGSRTYDPAILERAEKTSAGFLLCICRAGERSLLAARLLRGMGHPRAYSVTGGVRAMERFISSTGRGS